MTSPMLSRQVDLYEDLEKAIWGLLHSVPSLLTDTGSDLEDEEVVETIVKVLHKVGKDLREQNE